MKKIAAWVSAARLRTLPLSVSGILTGSATALLTNDFSTNIFFLALATTLGLQILSNFANDYGDGVKGTDNDERLGPMRALQSGVITDKEMKLGIIITSAITLILAVGLIYVSFGKNDFLYSLLFFALGIASILAAIKYTVGNSAYGYRGLGDVFVFVFFGLVSVIGVNFLMTKNLDFWLILPAISIGFLSSAVLNLNNMRDENSDRNSQKNTLVVKFGKSFAKTYHFSLIISAFLALLIFQIHHFGVEYWLAFLPCIGFILLFIHLKKVYNYKNPKKLDPELKKVALSTFLISLLLFLVYYFY
ncbi:MAG: 1,4-dihydroxy-2-naphthoate octaprenyltransferase [Psychroflexus sp.]